MNLNQIIFGGGIASILVVLGLSGMRKHWTAFLTKEGLHDAATRLLPRPIRFLRFISALLMLVLALMLGVSLVFLEGPAQHLADLRDQADAEGKPVHFSPEQLRFAANYAVYWVSFLLVLFGLVMISGIDAFLSWRHFFGPKASGILPNPSKPASALPEIKNKIFGNGFPNQN